MAQKTSPGWPTKALAALVAAFFLCAGGWILVPHVLARVLIGDPSWGDTAVHPSRLGTEYGVKLGATPLLWKSQSFGFQDYTSSVIFELTAADAAAFLALNRLEKQQLSPCDPYRNARRDLEKLLHWKGEPVATALAGLSRKMSPDAGYVELEREGCLVEVDGRTFILLEASSG